ncbi:MAG TPA: Crp/Fnr family transcriptional regulator [Candidatus Acidoferrum sp.]|nr:Crp/Fnr family transcriptional regulator [Candidatus Acidoferrum sp.]
MKSRGKGFLDGSPFFSAALPARKVVEFKAGETIISQGDECTDVHYIDEGIVKLTSVSNRGRGAVLGILGSGDFFGESCISGQSVYLTSAVALVCSKISVIRRKAMVRLVEEDPSVSMRFINYLLVRNLRMEQNLIDHLFNFSEKRLARTLLLLARSGDGGELPSIFEKISQDTLAEMVGTTRSRINFFMNKFRKLGFIHYNGGLKVHNTLARVLEE